MDRTYLIYDGRAKMGSTDRATVLEVCCSLQEALQTVEDDYDGDAAVYSYRDDGGVLTDERQELAS